jgi:hypothetical protein
VTNVTPTPIRRTPIDACALAWPQDDSYRSHIDTSWLRVLATWVEGLASDANVPSSRCFVVVTAGCHDGK